MSSLPINDSIFNWFVDYFTGHSHVTKYDGLTSDVAHINASVFQGSVIGPASFVITASDLKPTVDGNYLSKYADDTYLISPDSNDDQIASELYNIDSWARANNLSLNKSKSQEMIVFANNKARTSLAQPTLLPDITRVDTIKMLGVTVRNDLTMHDHVNDVCESAAQSLYAIKLLKSHGLDKQSTADVCRATVISRLTYASPAWWGFCNVADKQQLQAVANRAVRWGYLDASNASLQTVCNKRDNDLFSCLLSNSSHVLQSLLPPLNTTRYSLRSRGHNRQLPRTDNSYIEKNFIPRMLYERAHCN